MRGAKPAAIVTDKDALEKSPKPPVWLSKHAKSEWQRVVPQLMERRTLTIADLGSLENFCVASGQVREMQAVIDKEGHVMATDRGPRMHPAVRIQADAMTRARLLAAELGLTPVSRSRPSIREDSSDDDDSPLDL